MRACLQYSLDDVGGCAGDCGDDGVSKGFGPQAGVDVHDMQPRMAVLRCRLQVSLIRVGFCGFSQRAAYGFTGHPVDLQTCNARIKAYSSQLPSQHASAQLYNHHLKHCNLSMIHFSSTESGHRCPNLHLCCIERSTVRPAMMKPSKLRRGA